ncbi:hypothetical protein GCM10029963_52950 [Micromonospora andamanensis]
MTAPTINGMKYPQPVDALLPAARKLAEQLGEVPSRNRLMQEFRIGAPKAGELRDRLIEERAREIATRAFAAAPRTPGPLPTRVSRRRARGCTPSRSAPTRHPATQRERRRCAQRWRSAVRFCRPG